MNPLFGGVDPTHYCSWCAQPVFPQTCVILKKAEGDFYWHYECIADAGRVFEHEPKENHDYRTRKTETR